MSDSPAPVGALAEVSTTHVTLRYRPGSFAAGRIEELAERAEQVARLVARRLKPTRAPGRRPARVVLTLIDEPPVDGRDSTDEGLFATAHLVPVAAETPVRLIGDRTALVMIRDAAGGPSFWTPLADVAHAPAIHRALEFLGLGLARYLASRAENEPSRLFGGTVRGEAPLQSADQVVRQVAADRDGKVPLYECLMRGPTLASPPEYLALAESFCGYLFEREGPKAYFRFVQGTRQDVSVAADVRYGKNIEGLIDEWLGAVLRGQVRRPVTLNEFFRQILPYLRPYKWPLTLIFILIFLSSGVSQILPFQVRDITDLLVSEPARLPSNVQLPQDLWGAATAGEPSWAEVGSRHSRALDTLTRVYAKLGIAFVAFFVGATAIVWLIYLVNVVGQNILRDLRLMLTTRLHHLGAGFYARNRMGDMVVRFTSDIPRMADPLVDTVAYSVYHVVFLLWTVWAMFQMSWQLSMLLFFIVPVYFFSSRRLGPAIQRASRTRQERLSQLNANLEEMLFGHSVIKSYGLGGHLMTGFRPKVQEFRKVAIWTDFLRAIYTQFIRTVDNLTTKMVWALGASLIVFQVVTLGTLTGFNLLMGRFINPLHALSGIYAGISVAAASLRRVEEVLREPMEVMNVPPGGSYAPEGVAEAITFEDVNFSYTGAEPTLIDINLTIPAGSKVAFVGPTGAGKSTLASLIPRFYDVDQGAIRIDGRDIREFSLAGLRQSISIVSQDTFLFNSTILENIRLGRLDASDEDVIEAAKGARLHSFIETLSAGYDTLVGERGWRLSGGQKQRVAIARALLRNSPIMILDEATSALDAETEAQILGELDDVTKGKTVISITHRLGLALKSEKICVLQAGRIIQQGSHEELIQQAGLYRKLFEDQNRDLVRRAQGEQLDFTTQRVQSVPIFGLVPSEQIDHSVHVLRTEHYAAGDTFVPQEGAANDLYVLRSGQIELIVEDGKNGGQRLTIGAPRNGEGASSMSLLLSVPHSVSARVLADAELHVLRGDDLRSLLGGAWSAPAPGNGEAAQAAASVGLVPG